VHLAHPIPWWTAVLLVITIGIIAYAAYGRPVIPVSRGRRVILGAIRALTLLLLVVLLLRPTVLTPPRTTREAVVPILTDVSRSMRLPDAGGRARIERAQEVAAELKAAVGSNFQTELLTFGDALAASPHDAVLRADARQSDLSGALKAVRDRYRGKPVAGVIVLSDGGDTGARDAAAGIDTGGAPVYPIGIGDPVARRDREVVSLTAGDPALSEAVIDLGVSAVSHGFGTQPVEIRVLANGRPVDVRRVQPPADGSPIHETFTVSPDRGSATLYTVEIPVEGGDIAPENNSRSVIVPPPGRKRRMLLVEGAPGFEHSFLKRAWGLDSGIETDSVVRKGKNEQGEDTFFVQADSARGAALVTGYPKEREALFAYDAVVFGNVEADYFTRDQLAMTADFVSERGGGLLVLGARSFDQHGLIGTALEDVMPVELSDRRGSVLRTALAAAPERNKVVVTAEGEQHPLMRLALSADENRKKWAALPALPWTASLGGPRPGAQVLAVTRGPGDALRAMIAVQRYGKGRAMVFAGEASWRWRMALPSSDRTHELFWRQVGRWLSTTAPDPVSLAPATSQGVQPQPGDTVTIDMSVRDRAYAAVADATTTARVTVPGGDVREVKPTLVDPATGRYRVSFKAEQAGVYRVGAEARRGTTPLGTSEEWILVGGGDGEFADPRLNEEVLRRVAVATGGRYLPADRASGVAGLLRAGDVTDLPPERRDVWHNGWTFAAIVLLLSGEWTLRRRWGLR
jgi:uncharacterized membrane protein